MGKYGIGARVRHIGGEEGTVTGKAKGLRLVRFDGDEEGVWVKKQYLTPISEPTTEWQPKVGDRVRFKENGATATIRVDVHGQLLIEFDERQEFGHNSLPPHNATLERTGCAWWVYADQIEPLPVDAETQGEGDTPAGSVQIQTGKSYRTRDGRKVGPAVLSDFGDGQPWRLGDRWYSPDGTWLRYGTPSHYDLVAEWVDEPADTDPVAVAPATATPAFKVGDRVRVKPKKGTVLLEENGLYTIERVADGGVWVQLGIVNGTDFGLASYEPDRFDLVTPVTPPITTGSLVTLGTPAIVTGIDRSHAHLQLASGGSYTLPVASLVAAS